MTSVTYFKKWGFSINEGGSSVNIYVRWDYKFGFYLYFFGKRIYWFKGNK